MNFDKYFDPLPLPAVFVPEKSHPGDNYYTFPIEYGTGEARKIDFDDMYMVLIADYIPKADFEKIINLQDRYVEICQMETSSSTWKIGGRKSKPAEVGICCYANSGKTVNIFCEAGKPVRFIKVLVAQEYFDSFLKVRFGDSYDNSIDAVKYLAQNPNLPELNYVFQQIRDCQAIGTPLKLYIESKVIEILSLVTHHYQNAQNQNRPSVKLDRQDIRSLEKVVTFMQKDLSAYPTIDDLSKIAGMSKARFQLAFKQTYGTTVYEYLKQLRMNQALLLLNNSDYNISTIAEKVGYTNSGHFSGLFKKLYGVSPKKYRLKHGIK